MKECMLPSVSKACDVAKESNSVEKKRTRWWNEEVQSTVKRKKMLYKMLLNTGSDEARQRYNEAKTEARRAVRKAKNNEWVQLGRELEWEAAGNQHLGESKGGVYT